MLAGFSRDFVQSHGLDLRGMNFSRDIRKQLAGGAMALVGQQRLQAKWCACMHSCRLTMAVTACIASSLWGGYGRLLSISSILPLCFVPSGDDVVGLDDSQSY